MLPASDSPRVRCRPDSQRSRGTDRTPYSGCSKQPPPRSGHSARGSSDEQRAPPQPGLHSRRPRKARSRRGSAACSPGHRK